MQLLQSIRDSLIDPAVLEMDRNGGERIVIHRDILFRKKMMQSVFVDFYNLCLQINREKFSGKGKLVEIGAGISFFKKVCPELVVTDIVPGPGIDMTLDAQDMKPFEANSVRAMFGFNCFHHLPEPEKFFKELIRVLEPGGGCAPIEPYYGPIARPFYRNLHREEHFDMSQPTWNTASHSGVMTDANQALSYIVFVRDRKRFEKEFPELEIVVEKRLSNYLRYLFSGGLNFKQLLPDWSIGIVRALEWLLTPIQPITALHYVIAIRKRA